MAIKVVCAILEQHGRILVTQRSQHMPQPLLWEFPGGKVEPGETEEESLVREIKEEINLVVRPITRLTPVVHRYSDKEIMLIPYTCRYLSGVVQLAEHRSYQWAEPSDLMKYTWCPADVPIVEEYLLHSSAI
ncbi:(deoxy)nucleoside triphosphate pyrophosphohydrolase [Pontibacter ruber]|uniref:8-oxo-dGTP diphosphatase n=1 Tax=Pontibacter ruber TaxID=1343895 RepID=A0ABW5CQZ3_9BACT|nr:(deoxy)nucleoside triphosphate pyrophosphohydrolase [Pontibacter ruber]